MRHKICFIGVAAVALVSLASGEQPTVDGKPDLSGTWRLQSSAGGESSPIWIIGQSPRKIHIQELAAPGNVTTNVQCGTKAKECRGSVKGKDAKFVFYFNGPMLVQITRNGNDVTKIRRTLSDDGQQIKMEVIPYVPAGDPKTFVLVRAAEPAQHQSSVKGK